jgi:hypothetical protein
MEIPKTHTPFILRNTHFPPRKPVHVPLLVIISPPELRYCFDYLFDDLFWQLEN